MWGEAVSSAIGGCVAQDRAVGGHQSDRELGQVARGPVRAGGARRARSVRRGEEGLCALRGGEAGEAGEAGRRRVLDGAGDAPVDLVDQGAVDRDGDHDVGDDEQDRDGEEAQRTRLRSDMSGLAQRVPDAAHRLDERWSERVELLAQVRDVGLDDVGTAAEVVLPDVIEDLPRDSTRSGLSTKNRRSLNSVGESSISSPARQDAIGVLVQLQVGELEARVGGRVDAGPPQDRPAPGPPPPRG